MGIQSFCVTSIHKMQSNTTNLKVRHLRFVRIIMQNQSVYIYIYIYRVSKKECARLREGVPYVKVYRYNPKHLCPKLNGYGDNGQRSLKL